MTDLACCSRHNQALPGSDCLDSERGPRYAHTPQAVRLLASMSDYGISEQKLSFLLQPLAAVFRIAVRLRATLYRCGWLTTRKLAHPVVSVGSLTAGGAGKTPLVLWVAEALLKHGRKPGILTRGYGRSRGEDTIAIAPGAAATPSAREIGDEPALLVKALPLVPVVVCADRYRGGLIAEQRFGLDVHLLDDGFQHWALARDLDIVVLDATQLLSDRALLPAGRQREPSVALARAHLVVITRTEVADAQNVDHLQRQVQRINPRADVFRALTRLHGLRDIATGKTEPPGMLARGEGKPVVAFCGIGNPGAFFSDLRYWGLHVAGERTYRDHYVYNGADLAFLQQFAARAGAQALVTTEKDSMNLPRPSADGIPIFACVIRTEIAEPALFEQQLMSRIDRAAGNS